MRTNRKSSCPALDGFAHPGPWRFVPDPGSAIICHNDLAPWNACFAGDELVGIFDWDCAGPTSTAPD